MGHCIFGERAGKAPDMCRRGDTSSNMFVVGGAAISETNLGLNVMRVAKKDEHASGSFISPLILTSTQFRPRSLVLQMFCYVHGLFGTV